MIRFLYLVFAACVCASHKQANIVMFLTDDQDVVLNGMDPMANVHRLIRDNGMTFTNSFTATPVCCPSRASLLTGMYPHNSLTKNNSVSGGCYGTHWREQAERQTFATILQDAGYNTFYAGKYMNQYGLPEVGGPEEVPPGWSDWHGLVGNSVYYNYTLSNNGVATYSADAYLTDELSDLAVDFISAQSSESPFLAVVATSAPHARFIPAPRHEGVYANVTAYRNPTFNIPAEDKHWLMRMPPVPLPETLMGELDRVYRARWETLLAVDELVQSVVDALEEAQLLDDTYLIYTSDHGFHIGQFSQVYDKRQPYETDIRTPFVISGPGIPKNSQNVQPALNIDIAPTIVSLAGIEPPKTMDGHALDVFSADKDMKERLMLIEYYGEGGNRVESACPWVYDPNVSECTTQYDCKCQDVRNNTYSCIRHMSPNVDYKYCKWYDCEEFMEVYDLTQDPWEMTNIAHDMFPSLKYFYNQQMISMLSCAGAQDCDKSV